jgi:G:T-mismatch repair DNA endonuclease (very short patch repair protein)
VERGERVTRELQLLGFAVMRIWEHEVKKRGAATTVAARIEARVNRRPVTRRG